MDRRRRSGHVQLSEVLRALSEQDIFGHQEAAFPIDADAFRSDSGAILGP